MTSCTDLEGILSAIHDNRYDSLAWKALADWGEERGMDALRNRDVAFFFTFAGWSWGGAETPEQGRLRCAEQLAMAEEWLKNQEGHEIEWEEDEGMWADREGIDHDGPLYCCLVSVPGVGRDSLCGIDLGEDGSTSDPYCRVVVAELALELMPDPE